MKHLTLLLSLFFACNISAEVIYKTIPGTPFKDITEPIMVIDKNVIYKTIPGTPYKDITEPLMVIEKNDIYPTIPGTTLRDYSEMPGFVIE
jgi:nitrogen fixation protein